MGVISGGNVGQPGQVLVQSGLLSETATGTSFVWSATIPGGSFVLDVIVHAIAVWTGDTSANLKVGDTQASGDDDCYFTNVDLKANDLILAEGLAVSGGTGLAGGKIGADIANSQWNRRYLATERIVTATVTRVGTSGAAGRTLVTVIYTDPATVGAATVTG